MSKLALIGTFYQRRERTEMLLNRVLVESTRPPDEFWLICEEEADASPAYAWQYTQQHPGLIIHVLPTPLTNAGKYDIIPYSNKINWALDHTDADYIVYLDNNSTPHIQKYALMLSALEQNPEWGAVYCSQNRTGFRVEQWLSDRIVNDAYCVLNYTQVMHKKTADRWDLDMQWADPDLADARFWRSLHSSLGSFHPVLLGEEMLDEHYVPDRKAVGI
jgi:hypothetical protein